jgi:hypothetical protein
MAEPHVVSALKAKRAELAGEIELTTVRLQQLRTALHSLDEPKVWHPKADWVQRGEVGADVPGNAAPGYCATQHSRHSARAHDRTRDGDRRCPNR